jgi:hypothetical protein
LTELPAEAVALSSGSSRGPLAGKDPARPGFGTKAHRQPSKPQEIDRGAVTNNCPDLPELFLARNVSSRSRNASTGQIDDPYRADQCGAVLIRSLAVFRSNIAILIRKRMA